MTNDHTSISPRAMNSGRVGCRFQPPTCEVTRNLWLRTFLTFVARGPQTLTSLSYTGITLAPSGNESLFSSRPLLAQPSTKKIHHRETPPHHPSPAQDSSARASFNTRTSPTTSASGAWLASHGSHCPHMRPNPYWRISTDWEG